MRPARLVCAALASALLVVSAAGATIQPDPRAIAIRSDARVPFIENDGQIPNDSVRYYARLSSGALFVTADADLVYSVRARRHDAGEFADEPPAVRWAFRESFLDRAMSRPAGRDPSAIRISRFTGARPDAWHPNLRTYDGVDLGELYPGIRVALRAAGNNVEKLLVVSPGAQASDIQIAVEGTEGLSLDSERRLVLATGLGDVVFTAPVAYQTFDGRRHAVDVRYTLLDDDSYGFELGDYRRDQEVVIDPLLASTFIGGHNPDPPGNYDDDIVHAMVSVGDSIYIAGATQSPDFPIHMGYDDSLEGNFPDAFVTRMTNDLSTVLASTFIGTQYSDKVQAIAIDGMGQVVVAGQAGWGFPVTEGAYTYSGTTPAGGGFVSKLSPDLSTLVASAIVTPSDYPRVLTLGNGGIYFAGSTNNPDFPVTDGAFRSDCCPPGSFGIRPYEGFAGKISPDLTTLQALTYLGGNVASGVAVAQDGSIFITDGFDSAITGYLARFDADLTTQMAYLSYYPGSESGSSRTYFNDVAIGDGFVLIAGQTYMNDLPATEGAYDPTCGTDGLCDGVGELLVPRSDGFVAKYAYDLQTTLALTYLGGSDHESIRAVALDSDGDVIVAGETISTDFPTSENADDAACGMDGFCDSSTTDAFVVKLSGDLSELLYGSYLGGSNEEQAFAIAPAGGGIVFFGGYTRSADFPTTEGVLDNSYNGGTSDAFVAKFDMGKAGSGSGGGDQPEADGEGNNIQRLRALSQ